jgi:5'-phosphate synthase pdxT subunit
VVERVGAAVEVLAAVDNVPVLGRQGAIWFASFHPELAGDLRLHEAFLREVH